MSDENTDIQDNPLPIDNNISIVNLETENPYLNGFGKVAAGGFAVSCGLNAVAALATLLSGGLFIGVSLVLCVSTIYANYMMTQNDVGNIFMGGFKGLFQDKIILNTTDMEFAEEDLRPRYLSLKKSLLLVGGIFLSLMFGLTFGALTYGSMVGLAGIFTFLAGPIAAGILAAIGGVLGVLTFICLTALMTKAFADLIKTENLGEKIKTVFTDLFCRDPIRDARKSTARFVCERIMVCGSLLAMSVGVIGLVIWGQISTLKVCAVQFAEIFKSVTQCSAIVAGGFSIAIAEGCGLVAQIPFILKTSLTPVLALFGLREKSPKEKAEAEPVKTSLWKKIKLTTAAGLSSAATATIALTGEELRILPVLAGIGAFLNSFFGSVVNAALSEPVVTPRYDWPNQTSTSRVSRRLSISFQREENKQRSNAVAMVATPVTEKTGLIPIFNKAEIKREPKRRRMLIP